MQFEFQETHLGIPFDPVQGVHPTRKDLKYETFVQRCFEQNGWVVLNNNFSVFCRSTTRGTDWEKAEPVVERLFEQEKLKALRHFCHRMYVENTEKPNPGHPDLLVYRPDFTEVKFIEVKGSASDRLTDTEMLGLSLIHVFLETEIEIVRVEGKLRRYVWTWPCIHNGRVDIDR